MWYSPEPDSKFTILAKFLISYMFKHRRDKLYFRAGPFRAGLRAEYCPEIGRPARGYCSIIEQYPRFGERRWSRCGSVAGNQYGHSPNSRASHYDCSVNYDSLPGLFPTIENFVGRITKRSASFTALFVGNASATSCSGSTKLAPSW